jgi:hypothetical protein
MNEKYSQITDRMQSALAMTHHIQTRILGTVATGRVSVGVAKEIDALAKDIAAQFAMAAQEPKP